jgi:hypothetical protein
MVIRAFCAGHSPAGIFEDAGVTQGGCDAFDAVAHNCPSL